MAHFAKVENGLVTQVLVTDNDDSNGDEGHQWLINNLGGLWIKTSYNKAIRKNFAGVGFTYNQELDAFIPPKPYDSWVLDEDSATWISPIQRPDTTDSYDWDEESLSWIEFDSSSWTEILPT